MRKQIDYSYYEFLTDKIEHHISNNMKYSVNDIVDVFINNPELYNEVMVELRKRKINNLK